LADPRRSNRPALDTLRDISADELLGVGAPRQGERCSRPGKPPRPRRSAALPGRHRGLRRLQKIETLPRRDQKALQDRQGAARRFAARPQGASLTTPSTLACAGQRGVRFGPPVWLARANVGAFGQRSRFACAKCRRRSRRAPVAVRHPLPVSREVCVSGSRCAWPCAARCVARRVPTSHATNPPRPRWTISGEQPRVNSRERRSLHFCLSIAGEDPRGPETSSETRNSRDRRRTACSPPQGARHHPTGDGAQARRLSGNVSDYERGVLRLNGDLIVELARILDVSAVEILGIRASTPHGSPRTSASFDESPRSTSFPSATAMPSFTPSTPSSPRRAALAPSASPVHGKPIGAVCSKRWPLETASTSSLASTPEKESGDGESTIPPSPAPARQATESSLNYFTGPCRILQMQSFRLDLDLYFCRMPGFVHRSYRDGE